MNKSTPSLSIVIPVHNEGEVIERNLTHVLRYLATLRVPFEIIAVDDYSTDGSWQIIEKLANAGNSLRIIRHSQNSGKGSALKDGLQVSSGDWVVLIDADLELPIELIPAFRDVQQVTGADMVVGSKRHPESHIEYPLSRRLLSRGYTLAVRTLFDLPVSDTQVGFKLVRGTLARRLSRSSLVKRFAIDVELLVQAKLLKAQMADAPIDLRFSRAGPGRLTVRTILDISRETVGVWYRRYITGFYERALGLTEGS
jgi:glycosyltransferase involved in cell wall biosynthesis